MVSNLDCIPSLYRGDGDYNNIRNIKHFFSPIKNGGYPSSNVLTTNLANNGNGKEIFNTSFYELIQKHIFPSYSKTHFLSFSESVETALKYGANGRQYIQTFDDDWDFILLSFSVKQLNNFQFRKIFDGVYFISYYTNEVYFNNNARILLVNVLEYFELLLRNSICISEQSLLNAKKDKEWLILPVNYFDNNEFSSKIPIECINEISYYKNEE